MTIFEKKQALFEGQGGSASVVILQVVDEWIARLRDGTTEDIFGKGGVLEELFGDDGVLKGVNRNDWYTFQDKERQVFHPDTARPFLMAAAVQRFKEVNSIPFVGGNKIVGINTPKITQILGDYYKDVSDWTLLRRSELEQWGGSDDTEMLIGEMDLRNMDLRERILEHIRMNHLKLERALLTRAKMHHITGGTVDMSLANLAHAQIENSEFTDFSFLNAGLQGTVITNTQLKGSTNLSGATMNNQTHFGNVEIGGSSDWRGTVGVDEATFNNVKYDRRRSKVGPVNWWRLRQKREVGHLIDTSAS